MNILSTLFSDIADGSTIVLEKDKIYHVFQDDSFSLTGLYCTNTAKPHENPDGSRYGAIYLKNKQNITIDGNGATIVIHGKMTPFIFDNCHNITLKNLAVDYACPTMTEFRIISDNNGECIIKINPDCRFRIEKNHLIWQGEDDKNGKPYWESDYIGQGRYIKIYDPVTETARDYSKKDLEFKKIEPVDHNTLRVTLKNKNAPFTAGSIIQTRNIVRDQTGALFNRCSNLKLEDLRIMFMHGLGMVSQFCNNVFYKNCDFTPKEGRTIASTADFFQFSGCKGDLIIENCKAWGAQDDYVNVHGTHLRVISQRKKENSITVRFMHPESWGFQAFEKGDIIEFIKWDTLIPFGEATVISYERLNDMEIKLFLNCAPPPLELCKDVVENASWTPDLYVRNCQFGPTEGRGVLCTTRGRVIIENNMFRNLWGPALLIEDDCNFWFESGYTRDITFRNNKVINCEYASMFENAPVIRYTPKVMNENSTEFVHGKLTVENNFFEIGNHNTHCIHLEYLREAHIKNNLFDAPYKIVENVTGTIIEENNFIKKDMLG